MLLPMLWPCLLLLLMSCGAHAIDECPRSHCSNHGRCVPEREFEICLCDDDDRFGHFAGNRCQHCLEGYRPPGCLEVELLPDTTWLLLMALAFVFVSCGGVLCLRLTCYFGSCISRVVFGVVDVAESVERGSEGDPGAFPVIDPGNDSEEEQRKAEAASHRVLLQQIAGEGGEGEDKEDGNDCKICFSRPSNCVLLDCGHMCTCFECGCKLRQCPFCRKPIERVKKIYRI